jgi:hypothetical protein
MSDLVLNVEGLNAYLMYYRLISSGPHISSTFHISYDPVVFTQTMRPDAIPLQPLRSSQSSTWSLSIKDTEHVRENLHLAPPPPARGFFRRHPTPDRQTYCVGDPIFIGDSLTPYLFQGFTSRRTCNESGEEVYEGTFQEGNFGQPSQEFTLPIYRTYGDLPGHVSRPIPWWQKLWRFFKSCYWDSERG